MNRKKFLSSFGAASALLLTDVAKATDTFAAKPKKMIIPPFLKAGDVIGITSPAGYITEKEIEPAVIQIKSWGLNVLQGETIGKRDYTFGGTDEERRNDFQSMLDNPDVKAILCARGGYGVVRIIDQIDFTRFRKKPKWIIGFSDITVFHNHIHTRFNTATIHSKMCNSFPDDWSKAEPIQIETILSLQRMLGGEKLKYNTEANEKNRHGIAEGALVGGNLKMLETLAGTPSDLSTAGKIMFVEDTGEALYNIDRMFCHLKRTGKLSKLKALLVGGFTGIKPETTGDEFGRTVYDIVYEKVKDFDYPVCFGFPVGHQRNNFALKCGARHRVTVGVAGGLLEEI
ncbi:LD-carboxypeptidase [Sediminibacterium roseum]|uniref:LD-carboxypeptidase n=1 Tax=Sediminibacterium roseum TaxID=1978412 RepID=A0ABX0A0T2_9BACT|nr:LD-carboxypeptidase [Sediminibacterium roseum]NCI51552.1 LD-carboxypeptidase [Sediminibacterium roseum]